MSLALHGPRNSDAVHSYSDFFEAVFVGEQ